MITLVVTLNFLIAVIFLFAAWKVWKLRKTLAKVADTLVSIERSTHAILNGAPEAILKGQGGASLARQKYQQLEPQMRRVQQVMSLLKLGQGVWRWQSRRSAALRPPRRRPGKSQRYAQRF